MTFAQFLDNAGIHLSPALFIGIIAGGLVFIVLLVITVIYVHRRSKRQMMEGAFDKTAFSVVALAHPRPPLGLYQGSPSPRSSLIDREAQQHDLVGREVRQQEATYMQLMTDLQRPASRTGTPTLPNQTPREPPYHVPRMAQREPAQLPLTVYPVVSAPAPLQPPVVMPPPIADPESHSTVQLKRGLSIRSEVSTVSEYSVASAPPDAQERTYQPFTIGLPTVPASPSTPITPKWPSSPGMYVWPKRQRASQIRDELAPETYAKVRWKTDDESTEPATSIPIAQAVPSIPTGVAFGVRTMRSVSSPTAPVPAALRINVPPPPVHYRTNSESPTSASTAHLYYANAASTSPTPQRPPPRPF